MPKKLKLSPAKGEMGADLYETAQESLRYGRALRIDGNHEGEPFTFIVAKGHKAVKHLQSRMLPPKQAVAKQDGA